MQSSKVSSQIIDKVGGRLSPTNNLNNKKIGNEFKNVLDQMNQADPGKTQLQNTGAASPLKFSQHSVERMHSRGISFSPNEMKAIQSGVEKALAKGSKNSLILTGDKALIVSTKNNTVVTVMDRGMMKENVFTNIDSTVMV